MRTFKFKSFTISRQLCNNHDKFNKFFETEKVLFVIQRNKKNFIFDENKEMKTISYLDLSTNLKDWVETVAKGEEQIVVEQNDNKNIVLLPLEEYNALKETCYLLSGKNRAVILNSIQQAEAGNLEEHPLIEE